MKRVAVCVLILFVGLLAPLPAQVDAASKWIVRMGSERDAKALQALTFLPKEITINEGDTVAWAIGGGDHTVYFTAGGKLPDLIIPGKTKDQLVFNPAVMLPSPQKSYDGSGPLSGGAMGEEPGVPKQYSVTFSKAGSYKYVCAFHPGMEGTITVQTKGTKYPMTQAQYDQIAAKEAQTALAKAKELRAASKPVVSGEPGKRTFTLNMTGSQADGATFFRFPVDRLEIKRGETVTWVMQDPSELHTVTFGVGNKPFDILIMQPQPKGPPLFLVNMKSIAPAGGKEHTGKGFYNSGFMMTAPPGVPTYSLTFTKAGTYDYICATHAFFGMKGTIVVK